MKFEIACAVCLCIGIGSTQALSGEYRTIDGSGNNQTNPTWGVAGEALLRLTTPAYDDGLSTPRGGSPSSLPSARAVSNAVATQTTTATNSKQLTDWFWQWGQFLDHDIDLTPGASPAEAFNIPVPTGDPSFDPMSTGTKQIGLNRSVNTTDGSGVRQQVNEITAYIDASNVYGSDATRANALRTLGGDGKLISTTTTVGNRTEKLMMLNTGGFDNANDAHIFPDEQLFLSGDVRSNEQTGLIAAHTLFMREHNRLADDIKARLDGGEQALIDKRDAAINDMSNNIDDEGDFIYETARKVVGGYMQKITYEEFIPHMLGGSLTAYTGYDDTVDAGIANEFSTAAYRFGHTMLSPELQRAYNSGTSAGSISLAHSFFNPQDIKDNGVDTLLRGLASQEAQELDTQLVDAVRNFLFGPPGSGGFDLASLNNQRGRDHGLGSLNDVRVELGLGAHATFLDMTGGDVALANAFASVYASVDDVDLWNGGLAEAQVNGGVLGETFAAIVADQFLRLRDGDRFFYLDTDQLNHILLIDPTFNATLLSDIILRNSSLTYIQSDVFLIPEPTSLALLGIAGLAIARRRRTRG